MTPEDVEAVREIFRAAFESLSPEELKELVMEPYRELQEARS